MPVACTCPPRTSAFLCKNLRKWRSYVNARLLYVTRVQHLNSWVADKIFDVERKNTSYTMHVYCGNKSGIVYLLTRNSVCNHKLPPLIVDVRCLSVTERCLLALTKSDLHVWVKAPNRCSPPDECIKPTVQ